MQNITYYVGIIIGFMFITKILLHSIINSKKQWLVMYNDKIKFGDGSPNLVSKVSGILSCIGQIHRTIRTFTHAIIFGNLVIVVSLICQYFSFPSYSVDGLFYLFVLRVGYLAYKLTILLEKNSSVG